MSKIQKDEIVIAIKNLLKALRIDELQEFASTPELVSEFYSGFLAFLHEPPLDLPLYPVTNAHLENIVLRKIPFYSLCSHHLLPFFGTVSIVYRPDKDCVLGFSGIVRIVRYFSQRPTIQEVLANKIADDILHRIGNNTLIYIEINARQLCVEMRGVRVGGMDIFCSTSRNASSDWIQLAKATLATV
ncbi:MAG: GTP cyclohydrolase I [bacterium]|nr:GTP cyclohydrolase I [bacterium]